MTPILCCSPSSCRLFELCGFTVVLLCMLLHCLLIGSYYVTTLIPATPEFTGHHRWELRTVFSTLGDVLSYDTPQAPILESIPILLKPFITTIFCHNLLNQQADQPLVDLGHLNLYWYHDDGSPTSLTAVPWLGHSVRFSVRWKGAHAIAAASLGEQWVSNKQPYTRAALMECGMLRPAREKLQSVAHYYCLLLMQLRSIACEMHWCLLSVCCNMQDCIQH